MSVFYCDFHDRLEDADFVGYNESDAVKEEDIKSYCDEAWDIVCQEALDKFMEARH